MTKYTFFNVNIFMTMSHKAAYKQPQVTQKAIFHFVVVVFSDTFVVWTKNFKPKLLKSLLATQEQA